MFARAILPARRALFSLPRLAAPRQLSTTAVRRFATPHDGPPSSPEADWAKMAGDPSVREIAQKLAANKECLEAVMELQRIMKEKGVDPAAGVAPTKIQLAKFMLDSEFRQAMFKVGEEIQKAGIDPTAMQELMKRMGGA